MSNLLIGTFSLVLALYWFRYQCLMVLKARSGRDHARNVVNANNLSFLEVQERLQSEPPAAQLDALAESLVRDYRILTCLLRYSAAFGESGYMLDQRILMIDFRLMQMWYGLTRKAAPSLARRALEESVRILSHFADTMGQRTIPVPGA